MKRICVGFLAVCILVISGCSSDSAKPFMYVIDGAYNLTPQEFINRVNQHVEARNNSKYVKIPEFKESGEKIDITRGLHLNIATNDAGKIIKIEFSWIGIYSDANENAGLLMGTTIGLLTDEESGNRVIQELDMMNPEKVEYQSYSGCNESTFWYSSYQTAKFNFLTIEPYA